MRKSTSNQQPSVPSSNPSIQKGQGEQADANALSVEHAPWAVANFSHPHSVLGAVVWLMAHAPYHSKWSLHDVNIEILPPLMLGQFRLYHTPDGQPFGFVTWANVSEEVRDILIHRKRPIQWGDWNSGHLLMFNDFVAPFGHGRWMVNQLRSTLFANSIAFSLRRADDGAVTKIYRWEGKHYRQETKRGLAHTNPRPPHLGELAPKTHAPLSNNAAWESTT